MARSKLRSEVIVLLNQIEAQEQALWADLGRLKLLRERAQGLYERLGGRPATREELESYGALHDEVMRNN